MAENPRPDPFRFVEREFGSLRTALDRLMTDSQIHGRLFHEGGLDVDVYEREGKTIVEASLPGFRLEDISVELRDGTLFIRAERHDEQEEQGRNYYRRERRFGSVSRRIPLPGVGTETKVDAQFRDGVLRVEIDARTEGRSRPIDVREG